MKEPTSEQCDAGAMILDGDKPYLATWYPQMGGYGGRCLVELMLSADDEPGEGCFDVYVWHDGEFPFGDGDGQEPVRLHHCSADQFIHFGEVVRAAMIGKPCDGSGGKTSKPG